MASKKIFITVGSIIILVLSAIAFVLLPAFVGGSGSGTSQLKPFGYYKKQPIEYKEGSLFNSMLETAFSQHQQRGEDVNQPGVYYSALNEAFSTTVLRMYFADEVKESGYIVPEKSVDRILRQYFTDENGAFSQKAYKSASNSQIISLRKSIEEDLIYGLYYTDLFGDSGYGMVGQKTTFGLKVSTAEVPFIVSLASPEKAFELASFSLSDYPEEELAAYGKAHASLFQKLNLALVTVSTKAEAEKIARRIKNNEITFEDAVAEYSSRSYSSSLSGALTSNAVYQVKAMLASEDDLQALLQLQPEQMTGAIQTGATFSIFKSIGTPLDADFGDADELGRVYSYITSNDIAVIEDYFFARAQEFASAAAVTSFDAACERYGLEKKTTEPFPLNYGDNAMLKPMPQDVAELIGASTNENLLKTLFALKEGEVSSPVLSGYNVLVAKAVSVNEAEDDTEFLSLFYPYYTTSFDQNGASTLLNNSGRVTNNVLGVYLESFLGN